MGSRGILKPLDDIFNELRQSGKRLTVINDVSIVAKSAREDLARQIQMNHGSEIISRVPSCDFGCTKGSSNRGIYCPICKTKVQDSFDSAIEPAVWVRAPRGVVSLINPHFVYQLSTIFTYRDFNFIEWLLNTNYQHPHPPLEIAKFETAGISRGYNNFILNFEKIFAILKACTCFKSKLSTIIELEEEYTMYKDRVFPQHISVACKSSMTIEDTVMGKYMDPIVPIVMEAINPITGIDVTLLPIQPHVIQNRVAKCLFGLAEYVRHIYTEVFAGKPGIFRKHIYSTRNFFSARAVISPITVAHSYDELWVPWRVAISLLSLHLTNKLSKLAHLNQYGKLVSGYSHAEIEHRLRKAAYTYDPLIDQLFKELIAESPGGRGIPCVIQRNPSLHRGSIQRMFISRVKTDLQDSTISISILCVRAFNADFDGDAMALALLLDNYMAALAQAFAPEKNIISLTNAESLSEWAAIPKPSVVAIDAYLRRELTPEEKQPSDYLLSIAEIN